MLSRNSSKPAVFQMVDMESLVPSDHVLRKIDAVLDLSFVPDAVAECYSAKRGRPSIDPELALRMMLLGELYALSDRDLCTEMQMHAGMRWFCGQNFHDPVPDHSTLSRLRNERWAESGLFDQLMDEVLRQCCDVGLVSGRHLSVDGTEVRADVSMKSFKPRCPRPPNDIDPPNTPARKKQEPKPAGDWKGRGKSYKNDTHFSPTDPDARLYRKGDQREARPSYLNHDLIDTKSRVILFGAKQVWRRELPSRIRRLRCSTRFLKRRTSGVFFAEGKNQHGLARARRRGLGRVQSQVILSAIVQNLKRLVTFSGRKGTDAAAARSCLLFGPQMAHIRAFLAHSWAIFRSAAPDRVSAGSLRLTRFPLLDGPAPLTRPLSSTAF